MSDFQTARRMMVDGQIRTADVTDRRIISAMLELPRERFVPEQSSALAYLDLDLPVGSPRASRRLLKPMVLAKLVQALDVQDGQKALDVGCATGYGAALLARLGASVVALDEDEMLVRQAKTNLRGIGGVEIVQGALAEGHAAGAAYDVILLEGRVEVAPRRLCGQLAPDGRLVCIQGEGPAAKAMLYHRDDAGISHRPIFDATAAVLPGFSKPPAFVF